MRILDIKLLRDLKRLWAQALAIALVIAGGVATLVMAVGSYRTLEETRSAYYERYRFADVFATVRRAPKTLVDRIAEIPGVAAVEARVAKLALLDIPNFREPATAEFVSLPQGRQPDLNRLYLRVGRMPDPGKAEEVVISESFAKAHAFAPGARFSAILNGRKRELAVVGIALSPEFIYAIGPGDIMPDDRRFGIVWMSEKALANAYDLEGAFSSVSLRLLRGGSEREVIRRLDVLLDPYGGQAAYGRKDQRSHAFLDHELDMLHNMSRTLPPIFLLVAAFLVNLTLGRLVLLEREQVGLLKALGYSNRAIAAHYLKFVLVIAFVGIAIGSVVGTWLGITVTRLFGDFFRFPFLLFSHEVSIYATGALLSLVASVVGAIRAVREVVRLPPAVAMQPSAPPSHRHFLNPSFSETSGISQSTVMMLRGIAQHPMRTAFTMLGIAFATGILVVSLFTRDTMNSLTDVTYFLADRQDATISFGERRSDDVVFDIAHMPGVLAVEPSREMPVRIRHGSVERRIVLTGKPKDPDLSRVIDVSLHPVAMPEDGLAISNLLGTILGVQVGDTVEIDLLEGQRRTVTVRVATMIEDYFGIRAMMERNALSRLMRESPTINSVHVGLDFGQIDAFYAKIKAMPLVSGLALQRVSLSNFRDVVALLVTTMSSIYAGLAAIIAFGVVYNNARVSLSERARDLASLRVLGFTRNEVLRILLLELALLTLLAQPPGWMIGYGLAWIMKTRLAGELMRVRLVVEHFTFASASIVVIVAALFSAFVVRTRVYSLDLISVLKTRD